MITNHTAETLRAFEADIAAAFNRGEIRAPVHLDDGNEEELLELFREIGEQDWVCGSWRMHYRCLLKGIPPERLKADILAGKSITLCYPDYKIISSAIVGGILPIALGIAWQVKRAKRNEHVWVFSGDMTAETGTFYECAKYAGWKKLPITFVVESNGKSVCTDTREVWGGSTFDTMMKPDMRRFEYRSKFPHSGAGQRINF